MFLDEAVIFVRSGKGGDGSAHFRKEKHVPRGGPDGGDGGKGGDIVFIADPRKNTLIDFRHETKFRAEDGRDGSGATRTGKGGKSVELVVPVGTRIINDETGKLLADLVEPGQRFVACKGGRGGRGNVHFTSSVRQAPTFAEKGEPGKSMRLRLELSLLADVGLIGLPNAGKSTLISRVSAAKPKVADYPFTTLTPQLGIIRVGDSSFVMADLPGLIEGASEGKGLGHRFLRHAERTRVVLHVVECAPVDGSDPLENLRLVRKELESYSPELAGRPAVVALTKIDLIQDPTGIASRIEGEGIEVFPVSAVTGAGLASLLFRLAALVDSSPRPVAAIVIEPEPELEANWDVRATNGEFVVSGDEVERWVAMTDVSNMEALHHLHRRLKKAGVIDALANAGAAEGDTVRIGNVAFNYAEDK